MTVDSARSLLNLEAEFLRIDERLGTLAEHVELADVLDSDRHARQVRRIRARLRRALWELSGAITEAVGTFDRYVSDVPF